MLSCVVCPWIEWENRDSRARIPTAYQAIRAGSSYVFTTLASPRRRKRPIPLPLFDAHRRSSCLRHSLPLATRSWSDSPRWQGILRAYLTHLLRCLLNAEGWESLFSTERAGSLGDRGPLARPCSRDAPPGKGSPHPHSTRIAEGLGRGRPLPQEKV